MFQKYSELPGKGVNPKISDCTKWLTQKRERERERQVLEYVKVSIEQLRQTDEAENQLWV